MISSPLVLYAIREDGREKAIAGLCKRLGFRVRKLKPADANVEIGVLAGVCGAAGKDHVKAPALYQMPEMLIFSGMPEKGLDTFLAEYKAAGIEPVGLKAVVTPYNLTWTAYELAAELLKEQASMRPGENRK